MRSKNSSVHERAAENIAKEKLPVPKNIKYK